MDLSVRQKLRCGAKSKRTGQPCQRWAILGGTVCIMHGGKAPQVIAAAEERVRDILADAIDPNRVLRETARLAYSDIGQIFAADGTLLPVHKLPEDIRRSIASVEVVKRNVDSGDGKTDDVIKIRVWDKPKALEFLGKHLGLLTDKVEHSGALDIRWKGEDDPSKA